MPRSFTQTRHKPLRMPKRMLGYRLEANGCVVYLETTPDGLRVLVVPSPTSSLTVRSTEPAEHGQPMSVTVNVHTN